jgi:hypothetical protein
MKFEVGYILTRCFIQKRIEISDGIEVRPLPPTGSKGQLHNIKTLLEYSGYNYSRKNLEDAKTNFSKTGQSSLILFQNLESKNFESAIDENEKFAESIAGALSVLSANSSDFLCAFAKNPRNSGVKYYFDNDRIIRHATNVGGFLDAIPDLANKAISDPKLSLLLKLYRSSLREREIDNQILFQLILLEEASDHHKGYLADRVRTLCKDIGALDDLNIVAKELDYTLPEEKDMVDVLVKLRNCAAHNGKIDEKTLEEYNGTWLLPLIEDKEKLHKLVGEAIRYIFCCLVGHTRETMSTKINFDGGPFELRFD